ncbi:N-acetyltransferase [Povalibacter sp.]|uniref:GNAT family N-acetyltransferase n=1 Tax=Povalibacter sp. TaxID=1962978 RepID=UPI0032C2178D
MDIRAATRSDSDSIWTIMEPIVRAADTWTLAPDLTREQGLDYWFATGHEPFVAIENDSVLGIYYLRANQGGNGSHVANCGYMTHPQARGRGVARAMLEHSLERARERGFRAMQFNVVISTNERAVRTWAAYGFETVGRLPGAFRHPQLGYVDALVMYRAL